MPLAYSPYIDLSSITDYLQRNKSVFTVFSLNIQSINSKFSQIQVIISQLNDVGLHFGALCFQETWLRENDDLSLFHLPQYNTIHKGNVCCGHGGLIICLHNNFEHTIRNDLYTHSDIWEGLFIDITGENMLGKITLANIYKPPKNNNNNHNISCFIDELAPVLHTFNKTNALTILVGDFNIDLTEN